MNSLTPMMRQYKEIKAQHKDALLFFRLGDFYELFFDDAKTASQILNIVLTSRDKSNGNKMPMCGVPFHSAENYINKLIKNGHRVAICEQVEDPKASKGIVKRSVVRVISSGTALSENLLNDKQNNYLSALYQDKKGWHMSFLDLSTGDFHAASFDDFDGFCAEICRIGPSEIIAPEGFKELAAFKTLSIRLKGTAFHEIDSYRFDPEDGRTSIERFFSVGTVEGFGFSPQDPCLGAAGALLTYLKQTLCDGSCSVTKLQPYTYTDYMTLDPVTQTSLDLTESTSRSGLCLIDCLDYTATSFGGRMLRQWLLRPLLDRSAIERRLDGVAFFMEEQMRHQNLMELLKTIKDIERITARVHSGSTTPREVISLKVSLAAVPKVKELLTVQNMPNIIADNIHAMHSFDALVAEIEKALDDDAPATLKDGTAIRQGFSRELDECKTLWHDARSWVHEFQKREIDRTGIKSLKVRYNKVFGYYIDITKSNLSNVPEDYIRKQTLVNSERFITEELKQYEAKILSARERAIELEQEIFAQLTNLIKDSSEEILLTAKALGSIDCLTSLAQSALTNKYTRPEFRDDSHMHIEKGRHPLVEKMLTAGAFVPNDVSIGGSAPHLIIITGPNMAGKSTYLRQNALIPLMAQIGSYVPASKASLGVCDRIFTRIGASDDIAMGQSTFMVEMSETANILNNATHRSLIILDEIGRGTSTYDGISIAWAVAEYICTAPNLKCRTLFATHYHELTEMSEQYEGAANYNVAVKEWKDSVVFLHSIEKGVCDKSYGIHVAELAGMPKAVLKTARTMLFDLEKTNAASFHQEKTHKNTAASGQLPLFEIGYKPHPVIEKLKEIDVNSLTPLEGLNRLSDLIKTLKD